jgi:hypothetical protein
MEKPASPRQSRPIPWGSQKVANGSMSRL